MMTVLFAGMVLLFFAVSLYCINRRAKAGQTYSEVLFFSICAMFYFMIIPVQLYALGKTMVPFSVSVVDLPNVLIFNILFSVVMSVVAFYLGSRIAGYKHLPDIAQVQTPEAARRSKHVVVWGLGLTCAACFAAMAIIRDFDLTFSYTESINYGAKTPVFDAIYLTFALIISVLSGYLFYGFGWIGKVASVLLATFLFVLSVMFMTKLGILFAGAIAGYIIMKPFSKSMLVPLACYAGVLMIMPLMIAFSVYRTIPFGSPDFFAMFLQSLKNFSLLDNEPGGPFFTYVYSFHNFHDFQFGRTYFDSLYLMVPRFMWPGRPDSIAEVFAQTVLGDNYQRGFGFGFSPYTEGLMNFGPWFNFIHFFVFGMIWIWLWRLFGWYCKKLDLSAQLFDATYKIGGFFLMIIFFRGFFGGWLKLSLINMVPLIAALTVMWVIVNHRRIYAFVHAKLVKGPAA